MTLCIPNHVTFILDLGHCVLPPFTYIRLGNCVFHHLHIFRLGNCAYSTILTYIRLGNVCIPSHLSYMVDLGIVYSTIYIYLDLGIVIFPPFIRGIVYSTIYIYSDLGIVYSTSLSWILDCANCRHSTIRNTIRLGNCKSYSTMFPCTIGNCVFHHLHYIRSLGIVYSTINSRNCVFHHLHYH